MARPGEHINFGVKLTMHVALEPGMRIAIREAGRTIGACVVAKIIE